LKNKFGIKKMCVSKSTEAALGLTDTGKNEAGEIRPYNGPSCQRKEEKEGKGEKEE
jgi:hypothetical protein